MYLVFDIGGTNLRAGYSKDGQTLSGTKSVATPQSYADGLKAIIELGDELSGGQVQKAVIGVPGIINNNMLSLLVHLPQWNEQPLAADFAKHFNVDPLIRNDAELGAAGEAWRGAGKGLASLLYFTVGTGVGGASVQGNVVQNLEPGHQFIESENTELEQLVINANDKARFLALGIHNTLENHQAEAVILGGGKILNDRIDLKEVKSELAKLEGPQPPLIKAKLGDEAGLYGGLILAQ